MKTAFLFSILLTLGLLPLRDALGEDKKKDKVAEYQKQQLEQQQKLQQWKLEQAKKQQPGANPVSPAKPAAPAATTQQNVPVKLVVTNRTATPVAVFWVAFDGTPTPFGSIEPGGQPFVQKTFAGHTWQFRVGRQVVKNYIATAQSTQQVAVGSAPAKTTGTTTKVPADVSGGNGVVVQRPPIQKIPEIVVKPREVVLVEPGNIKPTVAVSTDSKVADFLRVHNDARARVGVGPLKWSEKLARNAQQWADQLAATGQFAHNPATTYGENIAGQSGAFTPAGAANNWLEERQNYQPGQPGGGNAGHYTQMVWRKTTHVGYGVAKVKGMNVVVANYEPAGNFNNEPPY